MMTWNRVEEKPVNEQKRRWNRKKQNKNVHSCQHSFALVTRSGCRQQFLSWPLDDSTICNAFVFNSRVRLHLLHVVPSPPLDVSVLSEEKYTSWPADGIECRGGFRFFRYTAAESAQLNLFLQYSYHPLVCVCVPFVQCDTSEGQKDGSTVNNPCFNYNWPSATVATVTFSSQKTLLLSWKGMCNLYSSFGRWLQLQHLDSNLNCPDRRFPKVPDSLWEGYHLAHSAEVTYIWLRL